MSDELETHMDARLCAQLPARRITVLGVAIEDITEDEAVQRIAGFIAAETPQYAVTINPEFVMEAQRNRSFRRVLAGAHLATPDGFGLLLVARLRGQAFRGRVTGIDLIHRLAQAGAGVGWSLFLLGAAPGVAERAADALRQAHPGLHIAGCYAGTPRLEDEPAIRTRIAQTRPDILLVAYGTPAQELWIARNYQLLQVPVAIGVGGAFDFLAGEAPRAPHWLRRLGLEWLYRLIHQPWRWRRIINAVPLFLWAAVWEIVRGKVKSKR
jgi:N-acetylglucosaminyldiphosphoundecaprenol N-acetyl-beta-D-mannosaminyltransferase